MRYPGYGYAVRHPHDQAIANFQGHEVRQTLIRAYFSPEKTTGQRYIYSGSHSGQIHVWYVLFFQCWLKDAPRQPCFSDS